MPVIVPAIALIVALVLTILAWLKILVVPWQLPVAIILVCMLVPGLIAALGK